jgi:glycosyltransferase involved in cell wall biosynthesis
VSPRFASVGFVKIAQVAPLTESVPPRFYGGTERVVAFLTDELVNQGHHVTLFASGDSRTSGHLAAICPVAQRLAGGVNDVLADHVLMLERVVQRQDDFDLIHFHIAQLHFPIARRLRTAHVTTLHGRLDLQELGGLYREFDDIPVVSISDAQRIPLRHAGWIGTVYHGLPAQLLRFQDRPGEYLAFLGRVSPEKGLDRAIAIATACGVRLRVAAKVDPADRDYFAADIQPLLDNPFVEFIGEIGEDDKSDFLGGARALLFPINWPEPFGLVLIEALACGLPVVAFNNGSVPEIIEDGVTGFVVNTVDEAVAATRRISAISRRACRAAFERRFSASRMASDYVRLYEQLVGERNRHRVA